MRIYLIIAYGVFVTFPLALALSFAIQRRWVEQKIKEIKEREVGMGPYMD